MRVELDFLVIVAAIAAAIVGYTWVQKLLPRKKVPKLHVVRDAKKDVIPAKQKELEDEAKKTASTSGGFGGWWAANKRSRKE